MAKKERGAKNTESYMESLANLPSEAIAKAQRLGAEDVVCSLGHFERYQIRFSNNVATTSNFYTNLELWVFLTKDGKTTSFELYEPTKLDAMLENAIKETARVSKNNNYVGIAKGPFKYRERPVDKKIIELREGGVELVDQAINAALEAGAERCAGVMYSSQMKRWHATTGGVNAFTSGAFVEISMRAFTGKDSSGHATASSAKLSEFDTAAVGRKAGEIAKDAKGPKGAEAGKMNVLFYPLAFAGLLNDVAGSASAFAVDAGFSFLKDKLGKKVGSEKFSLYDDATIEGGIFSAPFDDEGYPTGRTTIFDKGVVKGYLHNTSTAKKWNAARTGNAGLLRPHPWNVVMSAGDSSRDELLKGMKNGIVVTNIWYTRFQDYEAGDFSTIPRDGMFRVEDGKIVEAVKGIRISDNLPRMLAAIEGASKHTEQIHWWEVDYPTFCPDVLVKDVTITKSTA